MSAASPLSTPSPLAPPPTAHTGLEGLVARIDAALPQTQCQRCGYPDCISYARAIATHSAPINQCPTGGAAGVMRLAQLTGQSVQALNPAHGVEKPRTLAVIDEAWCIGCTLCTKVCPTDAIIGAIKLMHTVIAEHCTGCELCVVACPVDCIGLQEISAGATGWAAWSPVQAEDARLRYEQRQQRLLLHPSDPQMDLNNEQLAHHNCDSRQILHPQAAPAILVGATPGAASEVEPVPHVKQSVIAAVVARARQRQGSLSQAAAVDLRGSGYYYPPEKDL